MNDEILHFLYFLLGALLGVIIFIPAFYFISTDNFLMGILSLVFITLVTIFAGILSEKTSK
jgi:hypothetical protein